MTLYEEAEDDFIQNRLSRQLTLEDLLKAKMNWMESPKTCSTCRYFFSGSGDGEHPPVCRLNPTHHFRTMANCTCDFHGVVE